MKNKPELSQLFLIFKQILKKKDYRESAFVNLYSFLAFSVGFIPNFVWIFQIK